MAELTQKQKRFVDEYCSNGGNGTQAVHDAGYKASSNNSAAATASRLLRNVNVKAEIAAFQSRVSKKVEEQAAYTREMAIEEYNAAIEIAKKKENAGAMCTAIAGKAALCGLAIKDQENPADRRPMTREELEAALAELDELDHEADVIQMQVNKRVG